MPGPASPFFESSRVPDLTFRAHIKLNRGIKLLVRPGLLRSRAPGFLSGGIGKVPWQGRLSKGPSEA
jgi:hypothetical protein